MPKPLFTMSDGELESFGISIGKRVALNFESGVEVKGRIKSMTRRDGNLLLISFTDCLVTCMEEVLFEPAWGIYDMAVGERVDSAYSGAADPDAFHYSYEPPREKTHKISHTGGAKKLHSLYQVVRDTRTHKTGDLELMSVFETIKKEYPEEWLAVLEILELKMDSGDEMAGIELTAYLKALKIKIPDLEKLIDNGLAMIAERVTGIQATP
jgi:phenylalanine-4-hydroxylase